MEGILQLVSFLLLLLLLLTKIWPSDRLVSVVHNTTQKLEHLHWFSVCDPSTSGLLLGIKKWADKISLTIGHRLYKVQHQNYKAGFEVVKPDPKMGQCKK
jgi:hypothetical protein